MTAAPDTPRNTTRQWLMVLAGVACTGGLFWYLFTHPTLESLVRHENDLRRYFDAQPAICYLLASAIYVVATACSLPIATGLTLLYAWLFGFWPALLLVSFASTAGATLAFLLSRYLLGDWVQQRFGARLAGFNAAFTRDGTYFLFTLRLLVIVPFWLVNLLMGLTPIRTWTFWWVSQLGMLPATCIYIWTGANLPSLKHVAQHGVTAVLNWKLAAALAALGVFPWIARAIVRRIEARRRAHS